VTSRIDFNELKVIASDPCQVYTVDDFNQMDDNMDATMDLICGCKISVQNTITDIINLKYTLYSIYIND
jgi:hypothetical protein